MKWRVLKAKQNAERIAGIVKGLNQQFFGDGPIHAVEGYMSWLWCLHCEMCWLSNDYLREVEGIEDCPNCGAGAVFDGWPWSKVRQANPEYPEIPELGVVYPMYGLIRSVG